MSSKSIHTSPYSTRKVFDTWLLLHLHEGLEGWRLDENRCHPSTPLIDGCGQLFFGVLDLPSAEHEFPDVCHFQFLFYLPSFLILNVLKEELFSLRWYMPGLCNAGLSGHS